MDIRDGQEVRGCLTCRFARQIDPSDYEELPECYDMECHRMPPVVTPTMDGSGDIETHWPVTSGLDWCGEWREDDGLEGI